MKHPDYPGFSFFPPPRVLLAEAEEEWRDVVGYPGYEHYQVSDLGGLRNGLTGRVLRPRLYKDYFSINLCSTGRKKTFALHRLVTLAFHGLQPEGHEVAHLDGCPASNRADNLRWKTHSQNQHDRHDHGTYGPKGKRATNREIRDEIRSFGLSVPARVLAAKYGVTRQTISQIRNFTTGYYRDLK